MCELYGAGDLSSFPSAIQTSNTYHLELLGAPIGDSEYCNQFISRKHQTALALLSTLEESGSLDPQVALALLCLCSGFCKLIHIASATPPHLILNAMQRYDVDICRSFADCTGVDVSDTAWKQAKMSLRRGGLGLHSLVDHSSAAYIASFCTSGSVQATPHLDKVTSLYNSCVADCDTLSITSLKDNSPNQKKLSDSIEALQFNSLLSTSSTADRARLLSISSSAWISVVPSISLGLHFEPQEFTTALKWWLGVNPSVGLEGNLTACPLCQGNSLDPLGYHCVTCKRGGDVTLRHNLLRNVLFNTFRRAGLSSHLEVGSGCMGSGEFKDPSSRHSSHQLTVASPLNSSTITEAGMYSGATARAAELRKHTQNGFKCAELSWKCIPLAVECYGAWGSEALKAFSQVATRLAIRGNTSKSMALTDLFGRLSHSLIRANARAILSRSYSHLVQQVDELCV